MQQNSLSPSKYPSVAQEITAFHSLWQHIAQAPKKLEIDLIKRKEWLKKSRVASNLARKLEVHRKSISSKRRKCLLDHIQFAPKKSSVISFLLNLQTVLSFQAKRTVWPLVNIELHRMILCQTCMQGFVRNIQNAKLVFLILAGKGQLT